MLVPELRLIDSFLLGRPRVGKRRVAPQPFSQAGHRGVLTQPLLMEAGRLLVRWPPCKPIPAVGTCSPSLQSLIAARGPS